MRKHNFELPEKIRLENSKFNEVWISENKFLGTETIDVKDLDVSPKQKKNALPFMTVWLKNIDRLISLFPCNCDIKSFQLIDAGCGSGISTFYFATKYKFNSYYGFDFSPKLIDFSKKIRIFF